MITKIIIGSLLLVSLTTKAQFDQRIKGPVTWAGITLHENDTLHFSHGTLANGTFRFLSFYSIGGGDLGGSNYNMLIKKFKVKRSMYGDAKNYVTLQWPYGGTAYVSDLEGAINSGELTAINGKSLQASHPPQLIADELIKLKQLLDNGALTQQEFDQQKAKLLKQ